MLFRNGIIGAVVASSLILGAVATTAASTKGPSASGVSVKLVTPTMITGTPGYSFYKVRVEETNPSPSNCTVDIARYSRPGGWFYLGNYTGNGFTDEVEPRLGTVQYVLTPYDCKNNAGASKYSKKFHPTIVDNPFNVSTTVSSSRYYRGSAQLVTKLGQRAWWTTSASYNVGLAIGTGPGGAVADVYVDGVKAATIDFYSAGLAGKLVAFKFGTAGAARHTIQVVAAGRGTGGGTDMWLDAGIENRA